MAKVDSALAQGRNLLLLPGVYAVDRTIDVKRAHTVVLGLGLPSLTPTRGNVALQIADVPDVDVAGITLDAGRPDRRPSCGSGRARLVRARTARPVTLRTRPGSRTCSSGSVGRTPARPRSALEVNSDHVVLDDIWAWRADHGGPGSFGWTVNPSDTGVVVRGDDVTATGLFLRALPEGEPHLVRVSGGKTIFFQNEFPYDPPTQADWQHDGILGYAAYKVADSVKTHELWGGGGVHLHANVNPTLHATHGFEVPVTPGVQAALAC